MELRNMRHADDESGNSESGDSDRSVPPREGPRTGRPTQPTSIVVRYVNEFTKMAKKNKSPIVYVFLAIFVLISLALIVFILVREMTTVQRLQRKCGSESEFLQYKYPGYFRTPQQQREFIEALQELERQVGRPETLEGFSCQFQCYQGQPFGPRQNAPNTPNPPARRKRDTSIPWRYHSCCQSYKNHSSSPQFKEDLKGRRRELVQTESFRQYFPEEICRQVNGCQGCTCGQPDDEINQAVVYKNKQAVFDDEKYELEYLKFSGCCKCLNLGLAQT